MNSFRKGCNNNLKNCNSANVEKRIIDIYYNIYSVGCGLDLFAKGCNIKKMVNILKSMKR